MGTQIKKSELYWLLPLQASPGVLLLFILNPLFLLDSYGKAIAALQLLIACATIPVIYSLKHISFRIWACSALIVPLPILIFIERLYFEPFLIAEYYFYLTVFFILNYYLRKLFIFMPILLVSFFGSIFIWGVSEMFSSFDNDLFFYRSPILNFFLDIGDKMAMPVLSLIVVSIFGYVVFFSIKYKKEANI